MTEQQRDKQAEGAAATTLIEVMQAQTVRLDGLDGLELEVDLGTFAAAGLQRTFLYGLKRILNDAAARGNSPESKRALVEKRLADLRAGVIGRAGKAKAADTTLFGFVRDYLHHAGLTRDAVSKVRDDESALMAGIALAMKALGSKADPSATGRAGRTIADAAIADAKAKVAALEAARAAEPAFDLTALLEAALKPVAPAGPEAPDDDAQA